MIKRIDTIEEIKKMQLLTAFLFFCLVVGWSVSIVLLLINPYNILAVVGINIFSNMSILYYITYRYWCQKENIKRK